MDNTIINKISLQKKECIAIICDKESSMISQYRHLREKHCCHEWMHVSDGKKEELELLYQQYKKVIPKNLLSLEICSKNSYSSLFFGTKNIIPKI